MQSVTILVFQGFIASISCSQQNSSTIDGGFVYRPRYNDDCTNECSDTDPRYWCGKPRLDFQGNVVKCQQYTKFGGLCVNECGGKEKYTWCLTNAFKLQKEQYWEYCSLAGFTINREACTDECAMRGQEYFWCHNSQRDKTKWDYCSPPGLVKPLEYTRLGSGVPCKTECAQRGENYYWCHKSLHHYNKGSRDYDWEYCSLDSHHTIYNYKCVEECKNTGEEYFWCSTENGKWDYCSPKPKLGKTLSVDIELTRYGEKCRDKCSKKGEKYTWCQKYSYGTSYNNAWDYCSLSPGQTINKETCKDSCEQKGKSYFWCHTMGSWDYCSPAYVYGNRKLGYENNQGIITKFESMATFPIVTFVYLLR